jgi:hypothetical protein
MDIFCASWASPHWFSAVVSQQLPVGIKMLQVNQIPPTMPSLQAQVRYAEYEVEVAAEKDQGDVESALASLLAVKQLPWQHQRDTGTRSYDLRVLIDDLWLTEGRSEYCTIGMRLRCDNSGSGRPEQVAAALGFTHRPWSMHRTKLILDNKPKGKTIAKSYTGKTRRDRVQ